MANTGSRIAWTDAFTLITTVLMLTLACLLVWENRSRLMPAPHDITVPVPSKPVSVAGSPRMGAAGAPVAIVEYTDFHCPFSARFAADVLPALKVEYVGANVLAIFVKNLPLDMHPLGRQAAEAAVCANSQRKFWELHDLLFDRQRGLTANDLLGSSIGVDAKAFEECRKNQASAERVGHDKSEAETLGIGSTPTFLFGTLLPDQTVQVTAVLTGAKPIADFRAILDPLLHRLGLRSQG